MLNKKVNYILVEYTVAYMSPGVLTRLEIVSALLQQTLERTEMYVGNLQEAICTYLVIKDMPTQYTPNEANYFLLQADRSNLTLLFSKVSQLGLFCTHVIVKGKKNASSLAMMLLFTIFHNSVRTLLGATHRKKLIYTFMQKVHPYNFTRGFSFNQKQSFR